MDGNNEKWTVTAMKRNGAIWTTMFDNKQEALDYAFEIASDYPHLLISNKMPYKNNN